MNERLLGRAQPPSGSHATEALLTGTPALEQFRAMRAAFQEAAAKDPEKLHEGFFQFGGRTSRLRVLGECLWECMRGPWAHLQRSKSKSASPDLDIELWDQREAGVPCEIGTGEDVIFANPDFAWSQDGRFVVNTLRHSMTYLDRAGQRIVGCTADAERLSLYELGRPLRVPLTLWHNDLGLTLAHGALVAMDSQGVLMAGTSGSGKTTAALACLQSEFHYLGEDLTGLEALGDGSIAGHSVYGSVFLDREQLGRFPVLQQHAIQPRYGHEEKSLVLLTKVWPSRLATRVPIRAVALVRLAETNRSSISPAPRKDALLALAASSLLVMRLGSGARGFSRLVELVEHTPCFWLDLGRDLDDIPRRVMELLQTAGSQGGRGP